MPTEIARPQTGRDLAQYKLLPSARAGVYAETAKEIRQVLANPFGHCGVRPLAGHSHTTMNGDFARLRLSCWVAGNQPVRLAPIDTERVGIRSSQEVSYMQ